MQQHCLPESNSELKLQLCVAGEGLEEADDGVPVALQAEEADM
jgi:hypothetical protein